MLTGVNSVNLHDERSRETPVPRRERVRAATEAEILQTAQQLLVEGGPGALTLREVGRQMGMTASALYRYVGGHSDLVDRLTASFYSDLGASIADAAQRAVPPGAGPDSVPDPEAAFEAALCEAARAFRTWSLAHPAEFGLMFGGGEAGPDGCPLSDAAGERFGQVFLELFARGAGVEADPSHDDVFLALPAPLDLVFARTWVRLLGTVMVEVAGQTSHLPVGPDALFEVELTDCWQLVRSAVRSVRDQG